MGEQPPNKWAEMKILQRASRTMELVMKEALSIRTTPEDARFNGDSGCEPPDLWIATFKTLKGAMVLSFRAESFSTTATGADTELSKGEGILCKTHVQNIDHAHLQRAKN